MRYWIIIFLFFYSCSSKESEQSECLGIVYKNIGVTLNPNKILKIDSRYSFTIGDDVLVCSIIFDSVYFENKILKQDCLEKFIKINDTLWVHSKEISQGDRESISINKNASKIIVSKANL